MPLLELNCAALPDALLESELFGFEPGAFTDARRRKEGLLERAHGGTLFLDEIATMSASVQAKLLRVLEEGTFMRLGGTRPIKVNVRLVAATNADLKEAVAHGALPRRPLLPPQRRAPFHSAVARAEGRHRAACPRTHAALQSGVKEEIHRDLPLAAAELIQHYPWPGNIRELKNVIERTMILAPEGNIDAIALPEEIRERRTDPMRLPECTLQRRIDVRRRLPGEPARTRRRLHPGSPRRDRQQQDASRQDSRHPPHITIAKIEKRYRLIADS